jgi:hypothetical protein
MKRSLVRILFGAMLAASTFGCSGDSKHAAVSGSVTLDGAPIQTGTIRFVPADGMSATADAIITEGEFTAAVPPGEKRIEISAPKVIGKRRMMPDSPEISITEESVPAKYNTKSELTYSVTAGTQSKDFELSNK